MAESVYTHKLLTIKCCIESYASTIKKNPANIKIKKSSNDEEYLQNLIIKMQKKFNFLANLQDSEWSMQIEGNIVEKDGKILQEILERIPPIPVLQIVKTQISQDRYIITIHFDDQQLEHPLTGDPEDWDQDTFQDLSQTISDKFDLESDFVLFEDFGGGNHVDIDDMDDISGAFEDIDDTKGMKVLHLFIQSEQSEDVNRFKIMIDDGSSFFEWIPPHKETDDEKEWKSNWDSLLNEITKRYNFNQNDVELQQFHDGGALDVDPDELSEIWQELVEDDSTYVAVLVSNVQAKSTNVAPTEPGETANNSCDVAKAASGESTEKLQFKKWFEQSLQLPQYHSLFIAKGYANFEYISDLDDEELRNDIGIKSKPHRRKILNEIQKLLTPDEEDSKTETESPPNSKTVSPGSAGLEGNIDDEGITSEYQAWFENVLRLGSYYRVFMASGYEGFEDLECNLKDQDLIDIGIGKKAHRKRILNGIDNILNHQELFTDIKCCDFEKIAQTIHQLGGVHLVNHFKSPLVDTKERIWMALCRNSNEKVTAKQKLSFLKRFETEFTPNFDLTNRENCNVIHILCAGTDCLDMQIGGETIVKPSGNKRLKVNIKLVDVLLEYFVNESQCISKAAFIAQDTKRRTPLHYAVIGDKIESVRVLLPLYCDDDLVQLKDVNGESIMDLAKTRPQMKEILAMNTIEIDSNDDDMKRWFDNTVKLPQHYPLFIAAGYDMSYFDDSIDDSELKDVGITVQSDREQILNAIKSLAQAQVNRKPSVSMELKANDSESDNDDDADIPATINIVDKLVDLGSIIGTFGDSQKKACHCILVNILDEIKLDEGQTSSTLEKILDPISKNESAKFIECIVRFLRMIGFQANHVKNKGFTIKGASNPQALNEMVRNFYYLSNAMQKPKMNVYQQLNIQIPSDGSVVKHKSGLNDDQFITFQLPQIVMENQQSSLVNKVTLDPEHLERFINFLAPNSSKYLCKEIYFEKLAPLKVSSIGLFGSRKEILQMLMKYKAISKPLYAKLIDDETNTVLTPGIHGILPVNLQKDSNMCDWDRVIYLFYWSLPNSFDMGKMKGVKNMRKDPACLLSRVLYEISGTVSIMVSSMELHDFGVIKHGDKQIKKAKRTIRRVKLVIEETKEDHIMCLKQVTPKKSINSYSYTHKGVAPSHLFLLGGGCMTGWCQLYPQKARVIAKPMQWSGHRKDEVVDKIKELNTEYIIELDRNLSYNAKGVVAESIAPKQYALYKQAIAKLKDEENAEKEANKIKQQVDEIMEHRYGEILQAFFNKYNTKQYCYEHHSVMCDIMKSLGDDGIGADIAISAMKYASMEYRNTRGSLPKIPTYSQWIPKKIFEKLAKDLGSRLDTHWRKMSNIQKKQETELKAAELFEQKEKRKQKKDAKKKDDKGVLAAMANTVKRGLEAVHILDEEKIWTDEEIASQMKTLRHNAKRIAVRDSRHQRNQTLKQWIKLFDDSCETYRSRLYGDFTNRTRINGDLKQTIQTKYNRLRGTTKSELEQAMKDAQSTKGDMLTATLRGLEIQKATSFKAGWCQLIYYVPETIQPSYAMEFVSIDLKNTEDEMRTQKMNNMHYEMPQNSDLIFHYMMDNGDTIMFMRGHHDETKTEYVDVVASQRRTLQNGTTIKHFKYNVQLVSYWESQSLFAILFDEKLAFAKFEGGIRLTFTNKNSDLRELHWWNCLENKAFQAMFIQEIDKNIFVWLIDAEGVVHAYDYDANSWDSDKEFQLDQKYESYILSPAAPFLVAFKPQFEEDYMITSGNDGDNESDNDVNVKTNNVDTDTQFHNDSKDPDEVEPTTEQKTTESPEPSSPIESEAPCNSQDGDDEKKTDTKTPTGRIQLHAWLLNAKKKLRYKIHQKSKTGYETGNDPEMNDENKEELDVADNVLLPESFTIDTIHLNHLNIQQTTDKKSILLTAITADKTLLYHPLQVQVSDSKLKINKKKTTQGIRKTTKLDYMEYMVEKFGSRAAIYHPQSALLPFHTTYIMKDECKDATYLCSQIALKIQKSLFDKERKDFKHMSWECVVIACNDDVSGCETLKAISNKNAKCRADAFIQNLIVQIPIQIARGAGNQFLLMYNGADDQSEYTKVGTIGSRSLCKAIRFSAYDGLIKAWEGPIKVVTSMGKQSTGKSYMLNHLFGTKFDISGGRCTDGAWLSARVVNDTLYIICDFEGLGSFERSAQEDMLLATFNAALSNCTIFKCDNRFDRSIEDMFNKFQAGVKIMKGSENCFAGELMLIVKDVIDTGADAAVDDFERHIERLAQSSQLVTNDRGKKESTFFAYQMYKRGLAIIPYPPLANEAFFSELHETLHPNIVTMEPIHHGGKVFLDHVKLVMAKLNIGDYAAMSGEQAKIRATELRENLQNAVETGSIIKPNSLEYGVTFQVDDDQNLLLLDGNKVITATAKEAIVEIKKYKERIDEYLAIDESIEATLIAMIESIHDCGIVLGRFESLQFLWQQFSAKITRIHASFKETTNLFQLFLDIVYHRRKLRVNKYIIDNTKKFEKKDKIEIEGLIQSAESRLNMIRDKMRICKSKCDDCFYPCLLCKNHEDDPEWADRHSCFQTKHSCKEICEYCEKDGKSLSCDDKAGHSSKHNCGVENHTCGDDCSLRQYGGCQEKCVLDTGHDKGKAPCKCDAETHYCIKKCAVAVCHNTCKMPYNKEHEKHICNQTNCPYPCAVKCWNDALGQVAPCSRPCDCNNHAHDLDMQSGECKDEGHICDKEHPCPELCTEEGLCHVEVKKTIVKKETFIGGAGTKFEYDSYAECNAQTKRCHKKIPKGQFKHLGDDHKCYDELKENIHTCDVTCDACGYYCEKPYGHSKRHNGQHGNMRNTKFYASDTVVDTGDGRIYQVGDKGVAEICNIFCQRMGRGHIHLEFCKEHLKGNECVELPNSGVRHQRKPYKPDEHKEKDEVQHKRFWSRKGWDDPCKELCSDAVIKAFDKCPYICAHPSHEKNKKRQNNQKSKDDEAEEEEEEKKKYCSLRLWHEVCDEQNGCQCGNCHKFTCQHPFSKAHVIFVGDCSGSMDYNDGGKSEPQIDWIRNGKPNDRYGLVNRLGALYEAIFKFNQARDSSGCHDTCSVVMFESSAHVVAKRVKADVNFVRNYILPWDIQWGGTNFRAGLSKARDLVNFNEETVMIFLTDGQDSDGGASQIVGDLKRQMKDKFSLYCITLASSTSSTVKTICNAGKGVEISDVTGIQLGTTFVNIAKRVGGGGFM